MNVFAFEQEAHHLLFQQLTVLGVHHVELFLVNQHGLLMLPLRPRVLRDLVIDTFSQFAGRAENLALQRRVAGKYKKSFCS